MQEVRHSTPFDNGELHALRWNLDTMEMGHLRVTYHSLGANFSSNPSERVRLHFGLKGHCDFDYNQLGTSFRLKPGQHNLMYSQGIDMTVHNKTLEIETFGVSFLRDEFLRLTQGGSDNLKRFAERILTGQACILAPHWRFHDLVMYRLIQEIIHCRFEGPLKEVFLRSKAIELLVMQAEAYETAYLPEEPLPRRPEAEKLVAVTELLQARLLSPPTLPQVAKEVGLNEYKLKKGFKAMYGTTVFGYLARKRLHFALDLLRDTAKPASEIALDLGYASPQHFNNAFKKEFGLPPNTYRKNPFDVSRLGA